MDFTGAESPGVLAWRRLRRDRAGMAAGVVVLCFFAVALLAPVISWLYGRNPYTLYGVDDPGLLDDYGTPIGRGGGMSGSFWFGVEPGLGRDVFTQLVYGVRTSLLIALALVVTTTLIGIVFGTVAGYFGGKVDYLLGRITDLTLAFPATLFMLAFIPVLASVLVSPDGSEPTWMRVVVLVVAVTILGWPGLARLLRGQVLSLRVREFVEAARVGGAGPFRIIRRELLPNLWSPLIVNVTMSLPAFVTYEAALSYLGVGMTEPTPDWGRMIGRGASVYLTDVAYMVFPGVALLVFVLACNLFGDSVRDALDPRAAR
jgi:peptide/nickel transport system permease protein